MIMQIATIQVKKHLWSKPGIVVYGLDEKGNLYMFYRGEWVEAQ